ncbi:peptidyl-prolyl cis-trans cyclophilin-type family protein [Cryptosporidium ubiquitum]|uniref:Peptidyl-prolyl cis-trans cyclophilin-type family protein n=1 Tax=Cryptosporidium ubiquitum TaxID=857276 RepID=A0A1J4MML6_9CRYT|nr:peptidyl-prolyl cis-trans cyclophilin-type family protein [Cryptosporidium ubiquitum]OII74699.1 peptidyl-prolyl cis-trans cyclophilin-type family protein [Cryptosporidium ubiquitum]
MNSDLPTSGKLIFETTLGEIDIELWCKECPIITRRFLELCENGFFNGNSIKKVFKGQFIVLGRLEMDSKNKFELECNSRLKFKHRGMLGLFNEDEYSTSIESQYHIFITLDKIKDFNKYTLFGKIANDTIYNLMDIQNVEVDDQFSPKLPVKIIKTVIIMNPFAKYKVIDEKLQKFSDSTDFKFYVDLKKNKLINNRNLLSFYKDDEESNSKNRIVFNSDYKQSLKKNQNDLKDNTSRNIGKKFETCHLEDPIIKNNEEASAQNNETKELKRNNKSESFKKNDKETVDKLREFSKRLKTSLKSNNEEWYNRNNGLSFGVGSGSVYEHLKQRQYKNN